MSKFDYFSADRDLRALIQKSLDEPLTGDEVRKLEQALDGNESLRRAYLEATQLHLELSAHNETVALCRRTQQEFSQPTEATVVGHDADESDAVEEEAVKEDAPSTRSLSTVAQRGKRSLPSRLPWALPTAAAILIAGLCVGCGLGIVAASVMSRPPDFSPARWTRAAEPDIVARVTETHACQWQDSETPETLPSRSLHSGEQIRLKQGLLEVSFRNGARVVLEGPASLEIHTVSSCKLYTGKLTASAAETTGSLMVETPAGFMQLRSGEAGLFSDGNETVCHNFSAFVQVETLKHSPADKPTTVGIGQTIRYATNGFEAERRVDVQPDEFVRTMPHRQVDRFTDGTVWLGNLFDDSTDASLTEAMQTDGIQAAGETIDLGVAAVRDGGLDVDFRLVDGGVSFNLLNVGGGAPKVRGLPGNDTYRSTEPEAIRTTGQPFREKMSIGEKIEEGIGMCTNELITFDLDEIRAAGQLGDATMRFRVDRAGMNDRAELPHRPDYGSARFIAIVHTPTKVLSAYIDGKQYDVKRTSGVYAFALQRSDLPPVLSHKNNRFAEFDVPLSGEAKYLTLATAMWDHEHDDHAVFSGARLEIVREASQQAAAKAN